MLAALPMAVGQWGGDRNISSVLLRLLLDGGHQVSVRTPGVRTDTGCPYGHWMACTDSWSLWLNIDSGYVNSLGMRVCG